MPKTWEHRASKLRVAGRGSVDVFADVFDADGLIGVSPEREDGAA